jgi:hypothetical protein
MSGDAMPRLLVYGATAFMIAWGASIIAIVARKVRRGGRRPKSSAGTRRDRR